MQEIDVRVAIEKVAAGAELLDVRERSEWNAGHAPSATLLPLSELTQHVTDVPVHDEPMMVICHSGYRSAKAAEFLEQSGIPAVSVAGGMVAWQAAGGPVTESGSDAQGEPEHAR